MRYALLLLLAHAAVASAADVVVHPASVDLQHHRQPQSLQVLGSDANGYTLDLRSQAKFVSADPRVAIIDADGWVQPVGDGQTTITITVQGETRTIPVKVSIPTSEPAYSFRHEVMPILTRAGCNMGGCHGYSLGKNGFKLSLRGQDPDPDYFSIAKEFASRRVNRQFPEASLLLAKARGLVAHEGGVRFGEKSLSNEVLLKWIQGGMPSDLADKAEVVRVRMSPDKLVLRPGQKHHLQMIAEYSDGSQRDVTKFAVFSANNVTYADVDDDAIVTAGDVGETAVVGRFERVFAATSVMVLNALDPEGPFTPTPVPTNLVDRPVVEKLNRMRIPVSPVASDEEFLRRVHLDLIGIQPKPDEIRAFLADKTPNKREKLIDTLFERPEYVDQWSLKWGDLLQNSRNSVSPSAMYLFREFIRSAVASNMPIDEFARRLLTARGGSVDDPASVYFAISKDTNDTVERVTQVFCGVRMLCARCHSHPMENWTQGDYFGLASFFNQVNSKVDTRFPGQVKNVMIQINPVATVTTNPRTGKAQPPRFLGGEEPKLTLEKDRRTAYAEWLTSPKNPFFARGMVNRVWSYFFHRGIIEPVDDIRSTNPPINPALLDALTEDFIAHKFDIRHLMKRIVTSDTYQRSGESLPSNRRDEQNFSHSIPRRIPAEALLDSLVQATAVPEAFGGAPGGFRAAQLPDGNVDNAFLKLFGKPQRMDACECERDNGSNMLQALHFINGKSILGRVQSGAARPALLLRTKMSDEQLVTELYLWSLARHPSADELKLHRKFVETYGEKQRLEAAQDIMWVLLNSKEFALVR